LARKYGVPVTEEYRVTEEFLPQDLEKIKYPVIVKPVDSSGARGMNACYNEEELKKYYLEALKWSKSKKIIVEELTTGGQENSRNPAGHLILLHRTEYLHTIHTGQHHIQDNEIGVAPLYQFQAFATVVNKRAAPPLALQIKSHQLGNIHIILHNHDTHLSCIIAQMRSINSPFLKLLPESSGMTRNST
jgi:pyruvate carboxylase